MQEESRALAKATEEQEKYYERIGESIRDNITGELKNVLLGTQSFKQAFTNILKDIASRILTSGIESALAQVFGGIGGGGGGFWSSAAGFIGGLFGGGGGWSGAAGRARGGPVAPGRAYVVGERQPELFIPKTSGTIVPEIPTSSVGGGRTVVVSPTFNIQSSDGPGVQMALQNAMPLFVRTAVEASRAEQITDLRRPGTLRTAARGA